MRTAAGSWLNWKALTDNSERIMPLQAFTLVLAICLSIGSPKPSAVFSVSPLLLLPPVRALQRMYAKACAACLASCHILTETDSIGSSQPSQAVTLSLSVDAWHARWRS